MTKFVIFGECMVELVSTGEETFRKNFAGDTYNTAIYMKRCAPQTSISYLTAIGADFLSNQLLLRMGEEQINTDYVLRSTDRNLGLYMIRTDEHGERTFAYWRDNSAAKQTLNLLNQPLTGVDAFYFSGISLAILDDAQREKLFTHIVQLKESGCKIIFDPNYRPLLWESVEQARAWMDRAYASSDIAFPGGDDHLALYGHATSDEIFEHLADKNIDEIVLKNGAVGVHILSHLSHKIVPVERVQNVVDTTAAGDSFNAGYLAARFNGKSETDAVSYAAKVAATVISYKGAILDEDDFFQHVKTLS